MSAVESHAQRVLSILNQQRAEGNLCDAALNVGEGLVRLAHRNILACFSDMFQDMPNAQDTLVITLKDCPEEGLELLLDFIYTGQLQLDSNNCDKVQLAATSLCVPEVITLCQQFSKPPEQIEKPKRGRPKKGTNTGPLVKNIQLKTKKDDSNLDTATDSNSSVTTTTRSGRVVNCPKRMKTQAIPNRESLAPTKDQNNKVLILIAKDAGSLNLDQSTTEFEITIGEMDTNVAQLEHNEDNADGQDFENFTENTLDSWDHDYELETLTLSKSATEKRKTKSKGKTVLDEKGEGGGVQCPQCNKSFKSKYYLKIHNRRHTGEKPFECGKCGKRYFRKENLLEHEARNCAAHQKTHTCQTCSLTFLREAQLRLHMVSHTGDMPNKCSLCSEQFMHRKQLASHMMKLHGYPKPHACSQCDKAFMSRAELRIHDTAKHKGEKPFVCEECAHRASSRNGLKMHIKAVHRHDRPFVCKECGHAFTQKNNLTIHMLVHSGERPFQCHLCGKTFRTQGSLEKHNKTHTGERPFSCKICQQRFTEKGALMRHIECKHKEGRPHACNICARTFKSREQLRVHLNRHKGERKFKCPDCDYKFTRQAHLRRHALVHKRTENYNPRQRKFRNIIVQDLEEDSIASPSDTTVEASPKKTKKSKIKSKIVTDASSVCSSDIVSVEVEDSNEKVMPEEVPDKDEGQAASFPRTDNLEQAPVDSETFENTLDIAEIVKK